MNTTSMWLFLAVLVLICCTSLVCPSTSFPPNIISLAQSNLNLLKADTGRWTTVDHSYNAGRGIYRKQPVRNKSSQQPEKIVLMTVISYDDEEESLHYKVYLKNFICFLRHYDMQLVAALVNSTSIDYSKEKKDLESHGIIVVDYPTNLYWQILTSKTTMNKKGKGRAVFSGEKPSFKHHGAIVMLVPILEALLHGYDVIFFDVDIALVQDPISYFTNSDVDIILSMENRKCQEYYSTSFPGFFNYFYVEPNSGVMRVKASTNGVLLFRYWLQLIVEENIMNDQKAFDARKLNLKYAENCKRNESHNGHPSFCFLSEILFQNGLIGIQCPAKKMFRDDWVLEMFSKGSNFETTGGRFPVVLHPNYCKGKSHELTIRGLWLLEDNVHQNANFSCKRYALNTTYYSTVDWEKEAMVIRDQRQETFNRIIKYGSVIKAVSSSSVYFIDVLLHKRLIPSKEIFAHHFGEKWDIIQTVPMSLLLQIQETAVLGLNDSTKSLL